MSANGFKLLPLMMLFVAFVVGAGHAFVDTYNGFPRSRRFTGFAV